MSRTTWIATATVGAIVLGIVVDDTIHFLHRYRHEREAGHAPGPASVLSLRETEQPYPVDLEAANGPTQVSLKGSLQNPLAFAGARLELLLKGPSLAALYPLTGVPLRIGVNAGSLGKELLRKYGEPNADAMVESAMRHADPEGKQQLEEALIG